MTWRIFACALLTTTGVACGARSGLVGGIDDGDAPDTPRIEDCTRRAPKATPLARIAPSSSDRFNLSGDDAYVYFASDSRVYRLPKATGEAEAITAPDALGPDDFPIDVSVASSAGVVIFRGAHGTRFYRVERDGGDVETVATFPPEQAQIAMSVVGDFIVSSGAPDTNVGVLRTPIAGGESMTLLAYDADNAVQSIGEDAERAIVGRRNDIGSLPVDGGPWEVLADVQGGPPSPVADGSRVYFGSLGVAAVPKGGGALEYLFQGGAISLALDDEHVFALALPLGEERGVLVRIPKSGGAATVMADVDIDSIADEVPDNAFGSFQTGTAGLVVDDDHVYFIQLCGDDDPGAARLVRLPKDHSAEP